MTVAKILGIETEYGVTGGPDADPTLASGLIVNAYAQQGSMRTSWDFSDEHPDRDARDRHPFEGLAPMIEQHLANTVLTNGARLYVDHAHPEYSSPECRTPLEATLYDQAGEVLMLRAQSIANRSLPPEQEIVLYKNNSDGKGNSYGTHENYLLERDLDFQAVIQTMVTHFVSRCIVVGAGKVGTETTNAVPPNAVFQISARAEFFEEVVGIETTLKRPIINTRDEPHADPERFRRLHVINADASMSPIATFIKLGSTALLLAALEEWGSSVFPNPPERPVNAIRTFAGDPTLHATVEDVEGRSVSAWDYQDRLWQLAQKFIEASDADCVAPASELAFLMTQWREVIDGVRDNPAAVADRCDWVAKKRMIDGYRERYGLAAYDARLRTIDLQYHDLRPHRSLSQRAGLRRTHEASEIEMAIYEAPRTTRAYFRGQCLQRFPAEVVSANWDSVVFDVGSGLLQRIPMMDPTRGSAALTERLFQECSSAADLLTALNR